MTALDWRAGLTALAAILGAMLLAGWLSNTIAPLTPATPSGEGEAPTAWQGHLSPDRADRSRALHPAPPGRMQRPLPAVLLRIRACESGNDYRAENATSTASGAWQVLDGTWDHFAGYAHAADAPKAVQDRRALQLWLDRGTEPWAASAGCWR